MSRNKKIYGNWKVLAPDGELLNLVLEKRANWYLKRNLAEIVDFKTIKLNFEPKARKKDKYVISEKENRCVVCGTKELEVLTKHHIVPSEYRKEFPVEIKSRNCHDIVAICRDCHNEYESVYADELRKDISEKYDVPLNRDKIHDPIIKARKVANVIINHSDVIPDERKRFLIEQFIKYTDIKNPNIEVFNMYVNKYNNYEPKSHGEIVVEMLKKTNKIDEFTRMWRKHFVDTMKPKYMPKFWSIDRKHKL
jgi:hypothetical protein